MRKNNRKKALLGSLITMLLSFAMLLGTTFAWFTISVSSGTNAITAGNLDVKLEYAIQPSEGNDLSWKDCNGSLDLFGAYGTPLEPNSTYVVYFRVVNDGSLAMKYNYQVRLMSNTIGKNGNGQDIDLTDYVQLRVVQDREEISSGPTEICNLPFADRDAAKSILGDDAYLIKTQINNATQVQGTPVIIKTGEEGTLYPSSNTESGSDKCDIFAIVVHMPADTGREANHNGTNPPELSLQLDVVATQKDSELDSFDSSYDQDVTLPTIVNDNPNN